MRCMHIFLHKYGRYLRRFSTGVMFLVQFIDVNAEICSRLRIYCNNNTRVRAFQRSFAASTIQIFRCDLYTNFPLKTAVYRECLTHTKVRSGPEDEALYNAGNATGLSRRNVKELNAVADRASTSSHSKLLVQCREAALSRDGRLSHR